MTEMTETKKVEVPEGFMTGKFPLKKRAYGEEQPGIKVGPFKIRLPLIHHEWSWTEMAAAMFLGVACLGAGVTTTMTTFGLDDPANIAALGFDENGVFLMALTFGVLNAICYYLPSLLGDPVVPGWITPALPLTLKFLQQWDLPNYATGQVDRIYAMIALQMLVALSFLIMGATGIGRKLVDAVPMGIKAGIVLGAGVTAAVNVFSARMPKAPWTVAIAVLMSYFFLFNPTFARKATKSRFWNVVRNQGVVPAQLFAIILALMWYSKKVTRKSVWWLFDRMIPAVAIVCFCIRFGNLMNSEIFGYPTTLPWGFEFVRSREWHQLYEGLPCHPTQIYEMLYCLVAGVTAWMMYHTYHLQKRVGLITGVSLLIFFGTRFALEFMKNPQVAEEADMTFNIGQWLSVPLILLGAYLIATSRTRKE